LRDLEWPGRLAAYGADLAVVVAFGQILPQAVLEAPARGSINIHASLLPKYRGAAPIQWAIIRGETETGITTFQMNPGMDTGDADRRGRDGWRAVRAPRRAGRGGDRRDAGSTGHAHAAPARSRGGNARAAAQEDRRCDRLVEERA